ncbi:M48 family metalloprotease [Herbaspirillum sp. LeCh32-8]|uniref:M48 family metallopeptidase n=1 Tax=Herbaspirillum sp. LeCh32-8 TaxID=2821356 RepID=UPI001AE970E9|nr:M48 family metallopeptidase [Herbaspirillum sp. LeCh32-8]MBP0599749.1 M48 family metalloprotease [Herbaspirillum sp. LeCh32-8]
MLAPHMPKSSWQKIKSIVTLAPLAVLAACATQETGSPAAPSTTPAPSVAVQPVRQVENPQQKELRELIAQQDRLYRVAAPLLTTNAQLCRGNARNLLGFTAKNKYSFPIEYAETARSLGYDERLQVTGVLPGSGAEQAGIQRGDVLMSVAGKPMPQGTDAERQAAVLLSPLVVKKAPISLGVQRKGQTSTLNVPLTFACAFSIELGNADNVNTYADGRRVLITRGMMKFAQSDEELAYLIAKDMAHNILGHAIRQRMVSTIAEVIDNLLLPHPDPTTTAGTAGIRVYPQDLDAAADTLSLYLLARAGYGIDNVPAFWKRLAEQYPASVPNGYTALHPSTAYRLSMIDKVTQIVKAKQEAGKPLVP